MEATTPKSEDGFSTWAVIEIMGHQRLAGHVREETIAGTCLLRVDVPEVPAGEKWGVMQPAVPAFTTYIGAGSIYRMTPCTEAVARAAVAQFRERPVTCVDLPEPRALPAADDLAARVDSIEPEDDEAMDHESPDGESEDGGPF